MSGSLSTLRAHKGPFLDKVEREINSHIVGRSSHCIDIVEKSTEDPERIYCTWDLSDGPEFARVLFRFTRHKQYRGRDLDSALTVPVCNIVTGSFEAFYRAHDKAISAEVLNRLIANQLLLQSVLHRATDLALTKVSDHLRHRVVHLLAEQIHERVADGAAGTISHQVSHVAVATAGTQISAVVAAIVVKLLAAHVASVVAKIMASAVLKKIVLLLVKKIVITAASTAVLSFLSSTVGVAIGGGTIMIIILPALLAYLGYKIHTFPDKIGKKVSESVRAELSSRFDGLNTSIVDKVVAEVCDGEKLVEAIAEDKGFQDLVGQLVHSL